MDNNTLYHYGVLGMKWGRRKSNIISPNKREIPKHSTGGLDNPHTKPRFSTGGLDNPHKVPKGAIYANNNRSNGKSNTLNSIANNLRSMKKTYSESNSADHTRAKALKKKKLSQMSNAELKELNNRMQLESQYRNLKKQNISTGRKFVQDVMYDASKELVKENVKRQAKPYVDAYSDKCVAKGKQLVKMALGKN